MKKKKPVAISVRHIANRFGAQVVHEDVTFDVLQGEIVGIVGGSGAGKSVLLKTMVGLREQDGGEVLIQGRDIRQVPPNERAALFGMLFQQGALFSSLTVAENVMLPMKEHTRLGAPMMQRLAQMKLALAGLPPETGRKTPAELSGGMVKRASLARALALDPPILLLDEPTSGLDPMTADGFDTLIADLNRNLGLTVVMVTHDLDSLFALCHRVAVLVDKKVIIDTLPKLLQHPHPWIREYFHGPRARGAQQAAAESID
jgi:phospholipid/cholesterol/gamma-HCH transport system ATP-binding protein